MGADRLVRLERKAGETKHLCCCCSGYVDLRDEVECYYGVGDSEHEELHDLENFVYREVFFAELLRAVVEDEG